MDIANTGRGWRGLRHIVLAALAMAGLATAALAGPNLVQNGTFSNLNAGNNTGGNTCGTSDASTVQLTNCDLPNWYWAPSGGGSASGLNPGNHNYTFILNSSNYTSFSSISNGTLALKQAIPAPPDGGTNWLGADGAFQTTFTYTTVTGLVVGSNYNITFFMGAGQQNGNFTGDTTSTWQVGLSTGTAGCTLPSSAPVSGSPGTCLPNTGTTTSKTPAALSLPSTPDNYTGTAGFTGWVGEEVSLIASATSEVLWFMAVGTPGSTQPPFALLDGVSMAIPEPPAYAVLMVGLLVLLGARRFYRGKV